MSRAPKARTCYICGRPTLLPGYDIHVAKCREIFEQREAQKPPKERRRCPTDPYASTGGKSFRNLDEENEMINQMWKSNLAQCENCGRSFLPEKLPIHQRSCTPSNPAKSVSGFVKGSDASMTLQHNSSSLGASSRSSGKYGSSVRDGMGRNNDMYSDGYDDSRPLKGGRSTALDQYRDTPDYGHLIKCKDCGRNFNPESYDKHARICRKVFQSKRKVYDSAKHRAEGTELAAYYDGHRRGRSSTTNNINSSSMKMAASSLASGTGSLRNRSRVTTNTGSQWRQQSLSFRDAIRQAKLVSMAEKKSKETGIPLHVLLPANSGRGGGGGGGDYEVDPSYIQCPHCGRSFNQKAAERHIPKCQFIINKPSRLSGHSGAPSYSTNTYHGGPTTSTRRISGGGSGPSVGGLGFGQSTRESALNNRAITRWSEDNGYGNNNNNNNRELQMMTASKTHNASDAVRLNSNNSSSSRNNTYASYSDYGDSGSGKSAGGMGRRSLGGADSSSSMSAGRSSNSRPRGRYST